MTPAKEARYKRAVAYKAVRLAKTFESPFGVFAEGVDWAARIVPNDKGIKELLRGMRYPTLDIESDESVGTWPYEDVEVTVADVAKAMKLDADALDEDDIESWILEARDWVDGYLEGVGIA